MILDRRRRPLMPALLLAVTVTAATQSSSPRWSGDAKAAAPAPNSSAVPAPPVPAGPPRIVINPAADAEGIDPVAPISVTATAGVLVDVQMVNDQGRPIAGLMTPDDTAWAPGVRLGYGRTYTVRATGRGTDGSTVTQVARFSTVTPRNQTRAALTTTSGAALADGGTYGVGTVVAVRFDEPIPDRAAAERLLSVSTSPRVEGSWYWINDQKAHWRPREYFPPGTQVTAEANIYGAPLGQGLYGQEDSRVSFTIGPSHVSVADDLTKQVSVYENGVLVRTMPTSMGRGGTETVDGKTISFWTQRGVYTVMDKANPVMMDSSTYGLPVNSRYGYRVRVPYATRISPDGIYLHQKEETVWAQGNTNVSAGCLNLSAENAEWFYNFSQPGDVVEIRNTGGEPLQQWQNGDWSVPWGQWRQGSALT